MEPLRRRLAAPLAGLVGLLAASIVLHRAGVATSVIAVLAPVAGGALVLLAILAYLLPELERRFQRRLPERLPRLRDGVLIFRDGPAISTLAREIERARLDPIILETDEARARQLVARGRRVVFADRGAALLDRLELDGLRAIVANGDDGESANLIIAARRVGFEGDILALADHNHHCKPLSLAGANRVFAPRQAVAATLAARASDRVSPRVVGAQTLGRRLVIGEIRIGPKCPLAGQTLKGADIGRLSGVNVLGVWRYGELRTPVEAESVVEPQTLLVVAGSRESVARFREICGEPRPAAGGCILVAGASEVGRSAAQMLREAGEPVVLVDPRGADGVDVAGEISDPRVLDAVGAGQARAAVLALDSDGATLLAALAVGQHAPYVPILAAVDHPASIERLRRAGAEFAVAVSQVAAQLLAPRLLGRESLFLHPSLEVVKVSSASLVGRHPAELGVRERTGASIVAIERGDELIVALEPAFTFAEGDVVYASGDGAAIQSFLAAFPPPPRRHAPRAFAAGESTAL